LSDLKKKLSLLIFLSFLLTGTATGQIDTLAEDFAVADTQDVKVTLFDTDELFQITLSFDISYYKRKKSDVEYLDAVLTYFDNKSDSVSKKIKVRARGNIRRTDLCDFPPLMLNFKMKDSKGTEFSGINKLKLVPYCKVGYEDLILKEYLVYKLYNVLTDLSFRVRLFKITYINTAREKKPITQFGFAIEPKELLEKRASSKEVTTLGLSQRTVRPDVLDKMAIFNYMIGNTDWSVPIQHNTLLLAPVQPAPANENLIVPFDFDYAGLVGADYAIPFESLPIKTVRERFYMAVCRDESVFKNTLSEFSGKKNEFYKVINDFPYLKAKSKEEMIRYLDDFFNGIDNRNTILRRMLEDCRWFEEQANLRIR
jgi:hypothetical protein